MPAVATAAARGAEIAPPDGEGRQWVHLLPLGTVVARDGRHFTIADPEAIIARFRRDGIDLPVDFEHAMDRPPGADAVPAAGWIADLERRADGLWGAVRWTEKAATMIRAREYRFLSPTMLYEPRTGVIVALRGAGLVHHPALHLTALASEDTMADDDTDMTAALGRIAEALGLPEGATLDDALGAIARLATPDPRRFVPAEAVAELLRDRNEQIATMSESEAERTVDLALSRGYLTPAMRDWAVGLCRSDAESFRAFMAKATPAYAHLFERSKTSAQPPGRRAAIVDDDASRIAGIIGVKPEDLKPHRSGFEGRSTGVRMGMEESSTDLPEAATDADLAELRAVLDRVPQSPDVDTLASAVAVLARIDASLRARLDGVAPLRRTGRLTRIECDPALRAFIDARLGTMSQTDIVAACRTAFGQDRAPSLSGLNRYVHLAEKRLTR